MNGWIKSIFKLIFSNVVVFLSGILISFVVPKYLSIEDYNILQTYNFYLLFTGIAQLGVASGMYLKYGGINAQDIEKRQYKSEYYALLIILLITSIFVGALGFILKDIIVIAIALSIIPFCIDASFRNLYQATKQFNLFFIINISEPILYLISTFCLIYVLKLNTAVYYISAKWISFSIIAVIVMIIQAISLKGIKSDNIFSKQILETFKLGFMVMIANFSSIFFISIDRLFIKRFLTIEDFSYHAFALSLQAPLTLTITAIAGVFYPMLASRSQNAGSKMKEYLLMISTIISFGYFLVEFAVQKWLPNYIPSLWILLFMIAALPAVTVVNCLYINLYKSSKKGNLYLFEVIKISILSLIMNSVAIILHRSLISIVLVSLVINYFWFLISSHRFQEFKANRRDVVFIGVFLLALFGTKYYFNTITSGIIFLITIIGAQYVIYHDCITKICQYLLSGLNSKKLAIVNGFQNKR